ncbi:MAG: hypothetical protein KDN20_21035 [Verrucomicrobiae bacterium]|nr:hypothetical protein [Verrucomicrobiae bacterium]
MIERATAALVLAPGDARELALKTGTPFWVFQDGRWIDHVGDSRDAETDEKNLARVRDESAG